MELDRKEVEFEHERVHEEARLVDFESVGGRCLSVAALEHHGGVDFDVLSSSAPKRDYTQR